MSLAWNPKSVRQYESLWCLLTKLAYWNRPATLDEFKEIVFAGRTPTSRQFVDLREGEDLDTDHLCRLLDLDPDVLVEATAFPYIPDGSATSEVAFRAMAVRHLVYCPICVGHGFHSPIQQLCWVHNCPIHGAPLKDTCEICDSSLVMELDSNLVERPGRCPHGHAILNLEAGSVLGVGSEPASRIIGAYLANCRYIEEAEERELTAPISPFVDDFSRRRGDVVAISRPMLLFSMGSAGSGLKEITNFRWRYEQAAFPNNIFVPELSQLEDAFYDTQVSNYDLQGSVLATAKIAEHTALCVLSRYFDALSGLGLHKEHEPTRWLETRDYALSQGVGRHDTQRKEALILWYSFWRYYALSSAVGLVDRVVVWEQATGSLPSIGRIALALFYGLEEGNSEALRLAATKWFVEYLMTRYAASSYRLAEELAGQQKEIGEARTLDVCYLIQASPSFAFEKDEGGKLCVHTAVVERGNRNLMWLGGR